VIVTANNDTFVYELWPLSALGSFFSMDSNQEGCLENHLRTRNLRSNFELIPYAENVNDKIGGRFKRHRQEKLIC
jgi:hypothetical protein